MPGPASRGLLALLLRAGLVGGAPETCWLKGACRRAGRLEEGEWHVDPEVERSGLARPSEEEACCLARARQMWALCENTEFEVVTALYSLTGAARGFPSVHPVAAEQWGQLESFAHYQMTHRWKPSVNQFSDADVAPPLRDCDFDNGVNWPMLRDSVLSSLGLDRGTRWTQDPVVIHTLCGQHLEVMNMGLGEFGQSPVGAWAMSDATSDCFLGMLSLRLYELACSHLLEIESQRGGFGNPEHYRRVDRAMIGLEGLFFNLQEGGDPAGGAFEVLARTSWPVVELMEALAIMFRQTFQHLMPSLCDRRDDDASASALRAALARRFELASPRGSHGATADDWRLLAAEPAPPWEQTQPCAWRQVCVLLATAADAASTTGSWDAVARMLLKAEHWLRSWNVAADQLDLPFLGEVASGSRPPRPQRRQFFFDLLTSDWPVLPLLRRVRYELRSGPAADASPSSFAVSSAWQDATSSAQQPLPAETAVPASPHGSLTVCRLDACKEHRALAVTGQPPAVLFLGGGENTPQWAAFSLRGRQVARALRVHARCPAQVWQNNCNAFCHYLRGTVLVRNDPFAEGSAERVEVDLRVSLVVHVKFVCYCALQLLPDAKHVLDVVDNSQWINLALDWADNGLRDTSGGAESASELSLRSELDLDGVIVESRSGAALLAALPAFRRTGVPVFSIPHGVAVAQASLSPRSEEQTLRPVRLVAVHTTHWDPVYARVEEFLRELHPEVRFAHWSPSKLFGGPDGSVSGRMISPAQLRRVQAQLVEIDVTIVKQSGCLSEPDFCRQFKPGQRLINAWAAGVPTVIVLGDSSPMRGYLGEEGLGGGGGGGTDAASPYPPEAVVGSDGCAGNLWHTHENGSQTAEVFCDGDSSGLLAALDAVIRDPALRQRMWSAGLQRAERWAPERVAEAYALAFSEVLSRP